MVMRSQGQPLPAALGLLAAARHGLDEAATSSRPAQRYASAHLAALRCAAAVLAARARPEIPGALGYLAAGGSVDHAMPGFC